MSSRHSAPITGAPSRLGAVYADCVRRSSGAPPAARRQARRRAAFQGRFQLTDRRAAHVDGDIRLDERLKERARIVHELHDTLLQNFVGASMFLDQAAEQIPTDSPSKPTINRALHLVRRAIDEGRAVMRGLS